MTVHARRHIRFHVRMSTHVQNPRKSEKSPVPTLLSTVQVHMPNRNFVVATARLVAVTFGFHHSAIRCFI